MRRSVGRSRTCSTRTARPFRLAARAVGGRARNGARPSRSSALSASAPATAQARDSRSAALSGDGRFVAFASLATNLAAGDRNRQSDIFVRDRETGRTRRVSVDLDGAQANGPSDAPVLSADGNVVAFESSASNLVAQDANGERDVSVRDRAAGRTRRVSVSTARVAGNG